MNLFYNIDNYFKFCDADIKHEMAKRIMYSIIPSLAIPTEIYHTSGIVDYKALKAATEGLDDLVRYGVRAVLNELRHARERLEYTLKPINVFEKDHTGSFGPGKFNKIKRLMDAKELIDPIDVYKEVEDILTESGDIHSFKDWTTKIRNDKRYYSESEKDFELAKIRLKKDMLSSINYCYKYIDELKKALNSSEPFDTLDLQFKFHPIKVSDVLDAFIHYIYEMLDNAKHSKQLNKIRQFYSLIKNNIDYFKEENELLNREYFDIDTDNKEQRDKIFKKYILFINKIIMFYQSIG